VGSSELDMFEKGRLIIKEYYFDWLGLTMKITASCNTEQQQQQR